jgi:hypothetical protein
VLRQNFFAPSLPALAFVLTAACFHCFPICQINPKIGENIYFATPHSKHSIQISLRLRVPTKSEMSNYVFQTLETMQKDDADLANMTFLLARKTRSVPLTTETFHVLWVPHIFTNEKKSLEDHLCGTGECLEVQRILQQGDNAAAIAKFSILMAELKFTKKMIKMWPKKLCRVLALVLCASEALSEVWQSMHDRVLIIDFYAALSQYIRCTLLSQSDEKLGIQGRFALELLLANHAEYVEGLEIKALKLQWKKNTPGLERYENNGKKRKTSLDLLEEPFSFNCEGNPIYGVKDGIKVFDRYIPRENNPLQGSHA